MKTELLKDITNNKEEGEHLPWLRVRAGSSWGQDWGLGEVLSAPSTSGVLPQTQAPFSCVYSQQGSSTKDADLLFSPFLTTPLKKEI